MDETQTIDTGGSSWADWFQGVAGNVINQAAAAQYVKPYDVQALKIQSLGANGYYTEGAPGTYRTTATGLGISPTVLLLAGAAVLAVVLLKD